MTGARDALTAAPAPDASTLRADASTRRSPIAAGDPMPDERAARRAALRDLAAMIGVEVFY